METSWELLELACFFDLNKVYLPTYLALIFPVANAAAKRRLKFAFDRSQWKFTVGLLYHDLVTALLKIANTGA